MTMVYVVFYKTSKIETPLLQHPPRLHQLLRVPLQRGGHQVAELIQIKRPVWYFSRIGDI